MPTPARHCFISFSSQDEKRARAICDEMERRQIPCWISSRNVRPGRNYQAEIIEAIRNATHVVLVFSENANRSEEIPRELSLASKNHIRICPVRIKDVLPTGGMEFMLATSQWVDAFDDWNNAMDRLAAELADLPMPPVKKPPPQKSRRRRLLPIIGAATALAAVAAVVLATQSGGTRKSAAFVALPAGPVPQPLSQPIAERLAPRASIADVERMAASLDCAHVVVGSTGAHGISLSGFVQSAADEDRLLAASSGLKTDTDLAILPYPFCAVHSLAQAVNATDDINIDINHPDGHYSIGDSLTGSFSATGEGKLHVSLDLIQSDGQVFHLIPSPNHQRIVRAGDRIPFGARKDKAGYIEAADPPGSMVLLFIASDKPLPPPPRSAETAHAYLPRLKNDLLKLGASLSISISDLTVERVKN